MAGIKSPKYIKLLVAVLIMHCALCTVHCSAGTVNYGDGMTLYGQYKKLATDSIYRQALRYSDNPATIDSAVVSLSFMLYRVDTEGLKDADLPSVVQGHNLLGRIYLFEYGDYAKAYYNLRQALDIATERGIADYNASINTNLGALYRMAGALAGSAEMKERGLECLRTNFAEALRTQQWRPAVTSLLNIGSIALHEDSIGLIATELDLFDKAEIPAGTPRLALARHFAQALRLYDKGDYAGAVAELNEARAAADSDPREQLMLLTNQYVMLRPTRDFAAMLAVLQEAETLAQEANAPDALSGIYEDYQDYYEMQGNAAKAAEYELLYYRHRERVKEQTAARSIDDMESQYLLDTVNRDMASLIERQQRARIILIFSLVLLALVVGFLVYMTVSYRRLRQSQQSLYRANRELLASAKEQGEMRRRYAGSGMDDDSKSSLSDRLKNIVETSEDVYSEGFTLERLAQLAGAKPRQVSQVLNEVWERSFPQVVAEQRIREACRRIADLERSERFTIEAIAEEVGFKSRTHFIALFKKHTGLTPSQYRKSVESDK